MTKHKTLFVSDIHMGAGKPWDWFTPKTEGPYLRNFFKYVANRQKHKKDIKELVLLGDVFDLWVCPHNEEPHTFKEIIQTHRETIDQIKETAKSVPTVYVNGNHDFRVTKADIDDAFDGVVRYSGDSYHEGNILAEHGHNYALFNCPDPQNGGPEKLPLGYYLSRLHTTLGKSPKGKIHFTMQVVDESFHALGPEKLPESVIDTMKDTVEFTKNINVSGFNMGAGKEKEDFDIVRTRYRNLYKDWCKSKGRWYAYQMILCELNRLGSIADSLCHDGINIVIFGHSHDTKMDKDTWFFDDRIYANCGYWCGFGEKKKLEDNAHFVETDGKKVELYKFRNGNTQKIVSRKL